MSRCIQFNPPKVQNHVSQSFGPHTTRMNGTGITFTHNLSSSIDRDSWQIRAMTERIKSVQWFPETSCLSLVTYRLFIPIHSQSEETGTYAKCQSNLSHIASSLFVTYSLSSQTTSYSSPAWKHKNWQNACQFKRSKRNSFHLLLPFQPQPQSIPSQCHWKKVEKRMLVHSLFKQTCANIAELVLRMMFCFQLWANGAFSWGSRLESHLMIVNLIVRIPDGYSQAIQIHTQQSIRWQPVKVRNHISKLKLWAIISCQSSLWTYILSSRINSQSEQMTDKNKISSVNDPWRENHLYAFTYKLSRHF